MSEARARRRPPDRRQFRSPSECRPGCCRRARPRPPASRPPDQTADPSVISSGPRPSGANDQPPGRRRRRPGGGGCRSVLPHTTSSEPVQMENGARPSMGTWAMTSTSRVEGSYAAPSAKNLPEELPPSNRPPQISHSFPVPGGRGIRAILERTGGQLGTTFGISSRTRTRRPWKTRRCTPCIRSRPRRGAVNPSRRSPHRCAPPGVPGARSIRPAGRR